AFTAGDGKLLVICAGHPEQFGNLCTAMGRPELVDDPRFASPDLRRLNVDALEAELDPVFRTRPAAEWLAILEQAAVPCGPVNSVAEAVRCPQVEARHMVVGMPDPAVGTLYVAGNPIKITDVPEPTSRRPPPELDADRAAILAWLRER